MTGLPWIEEVGLLHSPIGITNTHSVGVVRDALVEIEVAEIGEGVEAWALPVVAETWDGTLNDVDGFHVTAEHAKAAYAAASAGPVAEGSVGGGTGMVCHDFKGGIGTASRDGRRLHGRRARPGQPRPPRAVPGQRRARRAGGRRGRRARHRLPHAAGERLDHRHRRDRRPAAAAAVPAAGAAGVVRRRPHRRRRREQQRRPLPRLRDRQPRHAPHRRRRPRGRRGPHDGQQRR